MSSVSVRRVELRAMLQGEAARVQQAADHLRWSLGRCQALGPGPWAPDELERLESMASRFARLSDLLTQRIMRLADELELEAPGSLIDRIRRAEKRGWSDSDGQLMRVRELRNLIAHEYEDEDLPALYAEVQRSSPALLHAVDRALAWSQQIR